MEGAALRTNVDPECAASMIKLHGQEAWDAAVAQQAAIEAAGGVQESRQLSDEERAVLLDEKLAVMSPIGTGIGLSALLLGVTLMLGRAVDFTKDTRPLLIGGLGIVLILLCDILFISALTSPGVTTLLIAIPGLMALYGVRESLNRLFANDLIRIVFPPLV